ncbi:hypothetical protein [Hymenobacter cheonanensis]|uniref:hypothetical protein n=1 Tax=Hymenobacter sp. CA2-7 TaxID=3063993 RepID=UPI0027132F4C|nr:hypothetical protein [Hymenobacter sp. CA2-7]MDO7884024.1 hypothetical protein [Hymenobacter sp. CA2-7]
MFTRLHFPSIVSAALLLHAASAQAQTSQTKPAQAATPLPQAMNYQGITRDASGKPLQNKLVALRISVLAGGADGRVAYAETHLVTTTDQGSFALAIGRGNATQGTFGGIAWGSANHFLRVEMDPTGGRNFRLMGASELLSVPYAFYAGTAGQLSGSSTAGTGAGSMASAAGPGVPSQVWSLFGNSGVNPKTDRLGTTDAADLVLITNNTERLTITSQGNVAIRNDLGIGNDLTVNRNVTLNTTGGATLNNGPLTVANASPTALSGTLNVTGATNLASTLNTVGATTLRNTLDVTGATTLNNTLNTLGATTLRSTLGVTGASTLNNTLHVVGGTTLDNTLNTLGATTLGSTLGVTGATNLASTLGVTGATSLASTLNTVGATTLRNTLGVDGATALGSTLGVAGASTLNNTLHVVGATTLDNSLNTLGATTLRSTLGVSGAATLGGSLAVAGATTFNNSLAANGQVTINTATSGGDDSYSAYPLRVQGSSQGIAIKLNAGTPDNSNNFVTFLNSSGDAVGSIEGQTKAEIALDPEYIYTNANLVATAGVALANVVSAALPVPVVVGGLIASAGAGECVGCIAEAVANQLLADANIVSYNVFAFQSPGVTYQSGSADYAEWLERSNAAERIAAGDIVAVNGGKISKYTVGAPQFMVISTKPAVLGNMPPTGQEATFEKVAFMGQIPVKVRGLVFSGDYILPSGLNDGTGIAVSPKAIKADQYKQIVGVAWSEALVEGGITLVNMAIGLNNNDLANLAAEHDTKLKALETKLTTFEQRLLALEGGSASQPVAASLGAAPAKASPAKELTRDELFVKNMPSELSDKVMTDAIAYLKDSFAKQGLSLKNNPGLTRLFTDTSYQAEVIHKYQARYKASYQDVLTRSKQ